MPLIITANKDSHAELREAYVVQVQSPVATKAMVTLITPPDPLPQAALCGFRWLCLYGQIAKRGGQQEQADDFLGVKKIDQAFGLGFFGVAKKSGNWY